ncbi:MAG TPA: gamma-glutamyltransferase, partial [Acetobacteraceae bacterium]|nr:gamma-glutamyltransferase [Acetobacteraceae bacterium]
MVFRFVLLLLLCLLPAPAPARPQSAAVAERHMLAVAHPLAADAGLAVLRQGGAAVDAAIAVQAVLTVVEPQSSGIGGGALLLHWDAAARRLSAWDGREVAPASATPELFLRDGKPMRFHDAAVGGRAVGVPGALRMLEAAHRAHGRMPWPRLFEAAIALAE